MNHLLPQLQQTQRLAGNPTKVVQLTDSISVALYPNSLHLKGGVHYFIAVRGQEKNLWIVPEKKGMADIKDYVGESIELSSEDVALRCPLNHRNASLIRSLFDFTRPTLIGLKDSFGFGDRLGIANPAHLRAVMETTMRPILAQQSIRELERTGRTPDEVIDAATWAVLQEGYKEGFGADADHLKTTDDIDIMVNAGFTMFTFDPGEYVVNEADTLPVKVIEDRIKMLPWQALADESDAFIRRYENQSFRVADDFELQPSREQVLRGLLKYGGVIAHTKQMFDYFKNTYAEYPAEFELSVDETASVTTPFEHYLVANELRRLGVELVSLAPRFVGDFEKGIDYRGDLDKFREEYLKHVKIAEALGSYKISIHSGSDKFSVYEAIGQLGEGLVHVKTAGTSYLEALRAIAATAPNLFREILDFSRAHYAAEKATYHVSADLNKVLPADDLKDIELPDLFESDHARQVLHVTFGKVLSAQDESGRHIFRERMLNCLAKNEVTHYEYLLRHFHRHLRPFASRR